MASKREERRRSLNEKKRLLKNSDVTIKNNCLALVILKSGINGKSLYEINTNEVEDIPFEDLQSIVKKQKGLFEDYSVLITDVYCPDDESLGVEDVKIALNLTKIDAKIEETPDDVYFDDLLSDETPLDEFEDELKAMKKQIVFRLAERAVCLYKEKQFANSIKMNMIEKIINQGHIFEDVNLSNEATLSDIDEL